MRRFLATLLTALLFCSAFAQKEPRKIAAVKTTQAIKIDGELNDEAWKSAPSANHFIETRPTAGKPEGEGNRSEYFILYDDNAIYVSGFCHELSKDSISTELVGRDRIGINDFAGVFFDTYRDGINGVGFFVTALGEQYDAKYSLNNEDDSWSTVYQTATKVRKDGWTFEMRIPYSALRFSKEKVQNWHINFIRKRTKTGQQYFWNPVDPNHFGLMNQSGLLEGISDINSPIRLSFSPYFSSYLSHAPNGEWNRTVNGGMDVKYGISKGFTLDMTLIPDFGQVQSDNQVLNLTPFEVRYNENRSFFTEGTELFNKGNLFYSRRIGGAPIHYSDVSDTTSRFPHIGGNDVLLENPSETKLINATKISGRTAGGLGVGFFNAITKPQYATAFRDNEGKYKIETNPLTNYNIIVLDQTMKHNSSVTLVNTNVTRNGSDYDANVTAGLWDLYDKKVSYNFWGKVANSRLMGYTAPGKTLSGYNYEVNFGKFSGPFNFEVHQYLADENYEQNDLGYFTNNNYITRGLFTWYKWTKPKGFYNNFFLNFGTNYTERFRPRDYQSIDVNLRANSQLKNLWVVGINLNLHPEEHDFYEPRVAGQMFRRPGSWMSDFFINTNSAKKYSASLDIAHRAAKQYHGDFTEMTLANQYRFSDRLSMGLSNYLLFGQRNPGFAFTGAGSDVVFGLREQRTVENILNVKYNFNIKMGLTFRARHYWSKVHYTEFFDLKGDGTLSNPITTTQNPDDNVNFFNIDMIYTWEFGPGSFINIAWKDAAQLYDQDILNPYYHNLSRTFRTPQQSNFSIKIIYYLDYLSLKKKHK